MFKMCFLTLLVISTATISPYWPRSKCLLEPGKYLRAKPCWDFKRATEETLINMNMQVGTQLASKQPNDEPGQKWEELRDIYLAALTDHIPKRVQQPRKEWISPATLDLIAARGEARKAGDLEAVEKYNKSIKKSARQDKKKHG